MRNVLSVIKKEENKLFRNLYHKVFLVRVDTTYDVHSEGDGGWGVGG